MRGYESRLSAALADRIDISLLVSQPDPGSWAGTGERSATVLDRVLAARERRRARGGGDNRPNAQLPASEIEIGSRIAGLLAEAGLTDGLSGRGRDRAIRLARTIADLDGTDEIAIEHAEEALALRRRPHR